MSRNLAIVILTDGQVYTGSTYAVGNGGITVAEDDGDAETSFSWSAIRSLTLCGTPHLHQGNPS